MPEKNELPEGWVETNLSNVGKITTGNTPPKKEKANYGDKYPWVKPSDLDKNQIIIDSEEKLSDKGASYARLLPINSVLVSCIGNLGKVGITGTILATNQQINAVSFCERLVYPKYGYYYCKILKKWLDDNSSATTIQIINKGRFSEAPFLIPPLPEQHRIVEAIEAIFTRLDAAEARLERVPEIMKHFRQSVLAAACDGRLTKEWRVETHDEWTSSKIKDLFEYWGGATPSTANKSFWNGNIPWISSKDMKSWKISKGELFITDKALENSRLRICPVNSVLVVVRSGILRHTLPVAITESEVVINQDLKAFYNPNNDLDNWLALFLKAKSPEILLNNRKDGTTVQSIKFDDLKNLDLLIPPKEEQNEIVRRVDALFALADKIEKQAASAKERTEKLRQSVLAQAFSGRLVGTEAEIARREGRSYESAGELLERIRKNS